MWYSGDRLLDSMCRPNKWFAHALTAKPIACDDGRNSGTNESGTQNGEQTLKLPDNRSVTGVAFTMKSESVDGVERTGSKMAAGSMTRSPVPSNDEIRANRFRTSAVRW
jgi:hypothetical protein